MKKFFSLLFILFIHCISAQDTLAKYTANQLCNKASLAMRMPDKHLWKMYFQAMMSKKPTDSLQSETYYNLAWESFRYSDYELDFSIEMMKKSIIYGRKCHHNLGLLYSFDSLSSFYAMKGENNKVMLCLNEIRKLHNLDQLDEISYLKFSEFRIYYLLGDFKKAVSIILKSNKNIDEYLINNPEINTEDKKGLIYDKKTNYVKLVECYNFQKKLDSSAYYIKKVEQIQRQGFPWHDNWLQKTFYLILSKKYDEAIRLIAETEKKGDLEADFKDKRYRAYYFLAVCWEQKGDYKKSLQLCEQAIKIRTNVASFINYELELYKLASSNASTLGDFEKEKYYLKKYNESAQKLNYGEKSRFIAQLYTQEINDQNNKLGSEKIKEFLVYGFAIILSLLLCYWVLRYNKMKKEREKFKAIISAMENNKLNTIFHDTEKKDGTAMEISPDICEVPLPENRKETKIRQEVKDKIIKQLKIFEKKERFLSSSISLNNMANDFSTNTAYLSAIIKEHFGTNFNGYINDLRIEYIITKLKTSPEYLNFKISYLAEECGYSSHTVFIRVFTEKTGITPSKFIAFLED